MGGIVLPGNELYMSNRVKMLSDAAYKRITLSVKISEKQPTM